MNIIKSLEKMVAQAGFEPATQRFAGGLKLAGISETLILSNKENEIFQDLMIADQLEAVRWF